MITPFMPRADADIGKESLSFLQGTPCVEVAVSGMMTGDSVCKVCAIAAVEWRISARD